MDEESVEWMADLWVGLSVSNWADLMEIHWAEKSVSWLAGYSAEKKVVSLGQLKAGH